MCFIGKWFTLCSKAKEGRKPELWGFGLTWTGKDLLDDRKLTLGSSPASATSDRDTKTLLILQRSCAFFFLFPAAAAEVNLLFWLSVHMIGGQRSKAKRWSRAKRWAEGRRSAPACLKHPGGQAAGQRLSSTNTHGVCQDPCRAAATHTLWEKHTENSRKHKHLVSSKQHTRPTSCCQFSPLQ